jgi:hypothetical protein
MNSFVCLLEKIVFHTWTIQLILTLQSDGTYYQFSIHERATNKQQYYSQQCYATEYEAYLNAYFVCLRAVLDREKCPAMIVDLSSCKILSINLLAFCLLGIDAVGFETYKFTDQRQSHEQLYQELQQTGESYQPMALRDADGKLMEIKISARLVADCSQWGIFRIVVNS